MHADANNAPVAEGMRYMGGPLDHATPPRQLPSDSQAYAISSPLTDLTPGEKLQYRLVVVREGQRYQGAVVNFQTNTAPNCASVRSSQPVVTLSEPPFSRYCWAWK